MALGGLQNGQAQLEPIIGTQRGLYAHRAQQGSGTQHRHGIGFFHRAPSAVVDCRPFCCGRMSDA